MLLMLAEELLISDLMFLEKRGESASTLILFSLIILVLTSLIAVFCISRIDAGTVSHPLLFKISAVIFFVVINIIWLLMIFISLLKRFMAIFIVFLTGMTLSILGVSLLGRYFSLGGALLGFSVGQVFTAASLFMLGFKDYKPGNILATAHDLFAYFTRYKFLFLSGLFYYWGMWIDKMVFWVGVGQTVPGTFIRLFEAYDIQVYFATLTMIPGLIYFIVVCETNFYTYLKEFLLSLGQGTYRTIQEKKYLLVRQMREGLREQGLFQGVITLVFMIMAPAISRTFFGGAVDLLTLRMILLAVFFQLLFLTLMTFLFYFELYHQSFVSCAVFFGVNFFGSIATVLSGSDRYGLSYMLAGVSATLVTALFLFTSVKNVERRILARYTS